MNSATTRPLAIMQRLIAFAVLICLSCGIVAAQETSTSVKADVRGGGVDDTVALVQDTHKFSVSVHLAGKHGKVQVLTFGFGQSQNALCDPPAVLTVVPLSCSFQDATSVLSGCVESKGAQGLVLTGSGECDPINLYWDHRTNRLAWWRN